MVAWIAELKYLNVVLFCVEIRNVLCFSQFKPRLLAKRSNLPLLLPICDNYIHP